ncbi:hypothetical protein [Micromonospora sp. URMC 103]|uniref:hypothetical protein n=1 Tax=Micromonospora sp. URMC 103 TaxID=3423406 RepID=UPI003F1941D3
MTEETIARLLTSAAEDVRPSQPAAASWERAARVRRTRRAAGAAALAVALLSGGAAVALRPAAEPRPTATASPSAAPSASPSAAPVVTPPAELHYPGHPLGRLLDPPVAPLSTRPVRQALALYQPIDRNTRAGGVIRVLGDDGFVRTLDVVTPGPTRDRGGNEAAALKPGTLSPDGRTAAFAQTGGLILVDLTTATSRRVTLDGYLELVVWSGDRVLVGGDDRTYAVDPASNTATPIDVSTWDVVAPDPATPADTLLELSGGRSGIVLTRKSAQDGALRAAGSAGWSTDLPTDYEINEFYGHGWQHGFQVARAAWLKASQFDGVEGVALLDTRTDHVTRLLDLGREGRYKACCEVLGWDARGGVLLRHNPGGIIRWQPGTGEVTGVLPELPGQVSLAR